MRYTEGKNKWAAEYVIADHHARKESPVLVVHDSQGELRGAMGRIITREIKNLGEKTLKIGGVRIFFETEYSDLDIEEARTFERTMITVGIRTVKSRKKTYKNPRYADNPSCDICHMQVTRVYPDFLLDDARTGCMACKRCQKEVLAIGRDMEAKKDVQSTEVRYETT